MSKVGFKKSISRVLAQIESLMRRDERNRRIDQVELHQPAYEQSSDTLDKRDRCLVLKRLLNADSVECVLDVGAYIGEVSAEFLGHFPNAIIWAFEPHKLSFEKLRKRFAAQSRVKPINKLICDRTGKVDFFINEIAATSSILPRNKYGRRYYSSKDGLIERTELPCVTIDDFCLENEIDRVNLLKLDIQGGEAAALRGAKKVLGNQRVDVIFSEVLFVAHYEEALLFHELCAVLDRLNYTLYDLFLDRHGSNGQIRFGDAVFISPMVRKKVVDAFEEEL